MKCPALMLGYHNRPDLPPPFTADGFYLTGDVFRRDADGFHYFLGRTDDMFVSGGENIYPGDVERMLERHPGVAQACVVPIDDDIKGRSRSPSSSASPATRWMPKRSSGSRSPTRPPISTRASSGSSTACRCLDQQDRPRRADANGGTAKGARPLTTLLPAWAPGAARGRGTRG